MNKLAEMSVALVTWEITHPETTLYPSHTDSSLIMDIDLYQRHGTPFRLFFQNEELERILKSNLKPLCSNCGFRHKPEAACIVSRFSQESQ